MLLVRYFCRKRILKLFVTIILIFVVIIYVNGIGESAEESILTIAPTEITTWTSTTTLSSSTSTTSSSLTPKSFSKNEVKLLKPLMETEIAEAESEMRIRSQTMLEACQKHRLLTGYCNISYVSSYVALIGPLKTIQSVPGHKYEISFFEFPSFPGTLLQ